MLRILLLVASFALSPYTPETPKRPKSLTIPTIQKGWATETARPCFIYRDANGDAAERCP